MLKVYNDMRTANVTAQELSEAQSRVSGSAVMVARDPSLFLPDDNPTPDALAGRPSVAFWSEVWRRFRTNIPAMVGIAIVGLFALLAVFAPMVSPYEYAQVDLMATFQRPNGSHWLGTDALGRDLWSGIWEGARVSLTVGLVAALLVIAAQRVDAFPDPFIGHAFLARIFIILFGFILLAEEFLRFAAIDEQQRVAGAATEAFV